MTTSIMAESTALAPQDQEEDESLALQQVAYRESQPFITRSMQQFAEHWALHRNQIKAYQHAYPGSSANLAKQTAGRLFADPRIQVEIRRVVESWTAASGLTIAQLEHELARLARSDIRHLLTNGKLQYPEEWDADTAAAVSSYQETETTKGRGENTYTEITRKVRLWDKHAAARTLLEAKGAFEKNKAPAGIQASFTINLGAGPQSLGSPGGVTIDMDTSKPAKQARLKKPNRSAVPPIHIAKAPVSRKTAAVERSHVHRTKVERADPHVSASESVEVPTLPPQKAKPDLF